MAKPFADALFGETGENLAAVPGEVEADIGFVEGAADTDLGVLHHLAGHQHRGFQERDPGLPFGLIVDHLFKVDLGALGQAFCRARFSCRLLSPSRH
jgi:hypothetical protein